MPRKSKLGFRNSVMSDLAQNEVWQQFCLRVDVSVELLFLAVYLDLLLVDRDPQWRCRQRVALTFGEGLFPVPNRLVTAIGTQPV